MILGFNEVWRVSDGVVMVEELWAVKVVRSEEDGDWPLVVISEICSIQATTALISIIPVLDSSVDFDVFVKMERTY